jgi:REP element-mobilizing transposase RayT
MPRKKYQPSADIPYHITARCINKEWFQIPLPDVWDIFSEYLFFINRAFNVKVHSFVLMNNHFHLILSTPNANLSEAMNYFMRETSRQFGYASGRINQIYGGPYFWSQLRSEIYYGHAYKYVYRNPVEAGLCLNVEDYPFSTLYALLGKSKTIIPISEDVLFFSDIESQILWLNEAYKSESYKKEIKNALRKRQFHFGKDRDRNASALENGFF